VVTEAPRRAVSQRKKNVPVHIISTRKEEGDIGKKMNSRTDTCASVRHQIRGKKEVSGIGPKRDRPGVLE